MNDYQESIKTLREFNLWRRGDDTIEQPEPREIGQAIDAAIEAMEHMVSLLNASQALIDRWETPLWKEAEHTGLFIHRLRQVVEQARKPSGAHITGELDQQGS